MNNKDVALYTNGIVTKYEEAAKHACIKRMELREEIEKIKAEMLKKHPKLRFPPKMKFPPRMKFMLDLRL